MTNNTDMIRDLRALTQAGMKDCKDALVETNWDIEKAVDLIKTRGKLIVNGSRSASEGIVGTMHFDNMIAMVEVNCVTDFVARMPEFDNFVTMCLNSLAESVQNNTDWDSKEVELETARKSIVSTTKENIVIRRWWVEQKFKPESRLSSYVHTNSKIGVILHLLAPTETVAGSKEFESLMEDLTLQIAAMNPIAISPDKLDPTVLYRQKSIFQAQIDTMNKPVAAHEKIMSGKLNKWYSESCLLNQESVITPKVTVGELVENLAAKVSGPIQVINFIRCQVGDGIDKPADNFADEVVQMAENPLK